MGKWHVLEEDEFVRDNSDGWCCSCTSEMDACRIRDRHNAEIAAIEEDNDVYRELHERLAADNVKLRQRVAELENEHSTKLKAVLEYLRENAEAQCQCEHNRAGERVYHCDYCQDYENVCRIAVCEA